MRETRRSPVRGFVLVEEDRARVLVREGLEGWVRFVLSEGRTLHEAASADPNAMQMEGRAPVYVIPAKGRGRQPPQGFSPSQAARGAGPEQWALRHFTRGGRVAGFLLGDRYFLVGRPRPFHEAWASDVALARGIATPRVLAAALYPGRLTYRGDLVTEFIPGASDLVEALFDRKRKGLGGALEREEALAAAGTLIRRMAELGLRHRDLHAGNILLRWTGASPTPFLLDLDRCEVLPEGRRVPPYSMYRRLLRSLRKWESHFGLRLTPREWGVLAEAVEG